MRGGQVHHARKEIARVCIPEGLFSGIWGEGVLFAALLSGARLDLGPCEKSDWPIHGSKWFFLAVVVKIMRGNKKMLIRSKIKARLIIKFAILF